MSDVNISDSLLNEFSKTKKRVQKALLFFFFSGEACRLSRKRFWPSPPPEAPTSLYNFPPILCLSLLPLCRLPFSSPRTFFQQFGGRSNMAPRKKHGKNNTVRPSKSGFDPQHQHQLQDFYEGERLDLLLQSIQRRIESARVMDNSLPEKIWFKLQFAVGVNDVTRVLERMKPVTLPMAASLESACSSASPPPKAKAASLANVTELQAVLIAADSNPRWLTKHLPSLALSRNVPLIFLKDNKGASLRLGQLVKLKTAIAIGVKAKGNVINQLVDEILRGSSQGHLGTEWLNSTQLLPAPE